MGDYKQLPYLKNFRPFKIPKQNYIIKKHLEYTLAPSKPELRTIYWFEYGFNQVMMELPPLRHKESKWLSVDDALEVDLTNSYIFEFDHERTIVVCLTRRLLLFKFIVNELYIIDYDSGLYIKNPTSDVFSQQQVHVFTTDDDVFNLANYLIETADND